MRKFLLASTVLAAAITSAVAQTPASTQVQTPQTKLSVGVFDSINGFTAALGQAPTLYNCYVDSTLPRAKWLLSAQYAAANCGDGRMTPNVGIPMAAPDDVSADASFKRFMSGKDDDYITGLLGAFKAAGYDGLYLRLGFEMNGGWFKWATTPDNAADFVAAFQHIARVAKSYAKANGMIVEIVWNPNNGRSAATMESLYPGDADVDVIGLDAYGAPIGSDDFPLEPPSTGHTITMQGIMQFAMQHNKPFALPETGGASAAYVDNLARGLLTIPAEKIAHIVIWDSEAAGCGGCSIAPGSDMATAWKALITQEQLQGVFLPDPIVAQTPPTAPIGIDIEPPGPAAAGATTPPFTVPAMAQLDAALAQARADVEAATQALIAAQAPGIQASVAAQTQAVSANNATVMIGESGGITDAAGNLWTITPGGQVAINGVVDPVTIQVTQLAYVDGKIWQKAWGGDWWGETAPNGAWNGQQGTSVSPLPAAGTPVDRVIVFDPGPIAGHHHHGGRRGNN